MDCRKKGKKSKKEIYVCRGGEEECGKQITGKKESIRCDACCEWFHAECQGLCKGAFSAISEYSLLWICTYCKERLDDILDLGKRVEMRVAEAEKKIMKKVEETVQASTMKREETINAGMKNLEAQVTKQINESTNTVKEVVKKQELANKIDRTCNVILHNIPENGSDEPSARKEHDLARLSDIAKALIGEAHQCDVEQAFRLGKKAEVSSEGADSTRRPRLLLVKLRSRDEAEKLLKERFSLKEKGFPNTYITRDLPLEEREKQRKLRAELHQKGKDTHKIVGDKVVPKN